MSRIKLFEGFIKDLMKPYIAPVFHEDIYGREGEHEVKVIAKRNKRVLVGDDKFFVVIEFDDGFTQEVKVNYDTYSSLKIGKKYTFYL